MLGWYEREIPTNKRNMDFDLIIEKGTVIDGTGGRKRKVDIGIKGDKIALLDAHIPVNKNNCKKLNAEGLIVSPGFIDIHSHSDFLWLARPESESKILDGITTEVCGNCGLSAFPLRGKLMERRKQGLAKYGIVPTWHSAPEFYNLIENLKSSVNRAFLVGHGNIRACTVEYDNRPPDKDEWLEMERDVEEALDAGAFGVSSGLIYPPGCYAQTHELVRLCAIVNKYGGLYATHIRNEGDKLEEAIGEAIEISKRSGVKLQISHIKTLGSQNWHKLENVKAILDHAIHDGVDVTCDRYPYIAAATDLDALLPHWTYEGGTDAQVERLKEKDTRKRLMKEMSQTNNKSFWKNIIISSVYTQKNKWMEGKTIDEIAVHLKKHPLEFALDLLIEEDTRVDIFLFNMCEENLEKILGWDFVFIGSDSTVRSNQGVLSANNSHPRSYGTFSRVLGKYSRENKVLPEEKAIQKMTGLPAQKLGLDNRGLIKEGYFADLTLFDPQKIIDKSTFTEPHQYSRGIEFVIVNGKITVCNGKHTGLTSGQILRRR